MDMQNIEIKSREQAAATIAEWRKIDRGFIRSYQAVIITAVVVISAILGWWIVLAALCGLLIEADAY